MVSKAGDREALFGRTNKAGDFSIQFSAIVLLWFYLRKKNSNDELKPELFSRRWFEFDEESGERSLSLIKREWNRVSQQIKPLAFITCEKILTFFFSHIQTLLNKLHHREKHNGNEVTCNSNKCVLLFQLGEKIY